MEPLVEKKDVKTTLKNVAFFAVAFFAPLLTLINQFNERHPFIPFLLAVPLFALAGYKVENNKKWVAWAALVGAVEAALISFAV